jgi:PAS domain S-box-containing protein
MQVAKQPDETPPESMDELRRRLEAAESRLRGFLATAADWCWETDAEGRLTWISRETAATAGALGRSRWEIAGADPAADPAWRAHLEDLQAARPFRDFRYSLALPDGKALHLSISGDPAFRPDGRLAGWRGTGRDVSAEVRRERALRESERRFRELIEGSMQGVAINQRGRIVYANEALCRMLGYARDEVAGQDRWLPVAPDDLERVKRLQRRRDPQRFAFRGRRKDGQLLWLECMVRRIEWDGAPAWQVVLMDVTERRQAEERLLQAQNMDAVGQLTGGLAHNFNNLLAAILGNLDIIRQADLLPPTEARMLDSAVAAASRGARLVQSQLAFARRQQLNSKRIDVSELVARMAELLRQALGPAIQLDAPRPIEPHFATVDPALLEAALLNLALNARDAMPAGGRLTIEMRNVQLDADEPDAQPGRYVMLAVSDTGTGMAKEVRERVFEPFYTTREVGAGAGLGLSMVYGFVKQSGGHVRLYSEPGVGTSFKLFLPAAGGPAAAEPTAAGRLRGLRVLLVEDDAEVSATVLAMLGALGCEATTARDGPQALSALRGAAAFDLLLTDVVLPGGLRGPELAAAALAMRPGLKTLFMSGYAPQAALTNAAFPSGALLSKPFRRAELARALLRTIAP